MNASAPSHGGELVELAAVVRAHGLQGELLLKLFNPESELLPTLKEVVLRSASGETRSYDVSAIRGGENATLMALRGVHRREEAEALRGSVVCVPRSALPPLDEDEYYLLDLVGLAVHTASGEAIGSVRDVIQYPSVQCMLVVTSGEWREVPNLPRYVLDVRVAEGFVVLDHLDEIDTVKPPAPGQT